MQESAKRAWRILLGPGTSKQREVYSNGQKNGICAAFAARGLRFGARKKTHHSQGSLTCGTSLHAQQSGMVCTRQRRGKRFDRRTSQLDRRQGQPFRRATRISPGVLEPTESLKT